ncbi:MAG: hypothetical protein ISS45_09635 [Candidatus Omnitrophica bacterium]|nr:hypothetical protein [Candidatus Omnitrophota bacterium]
MKKIKFSITILISCSILFAYDYSWADYSSQQQLIREVTSPNPDVPKIHQLMHEIPEYKEEDNLLSSSSISISSADEKILRSLTQTSFASSPTSYPLPQLCANCHLPDENYPTVGYNSARNNETALQYRNEERLRRIKEEGDPYESGGRQPYYCGTVNLPLDEIYRRLNANDYSLSNNSSWEDSGEITGAKHYYDFKKEKLTKLEKIMLYALVPSLLRPAATIYLLSPERQKHVRIFPTEEEGVYEIRAHDEPSILHPLQHLHYTSSTVSDNYDEIKQIFPKMEGEPERGSWTSEGKINKGLREIGIKIKNFFRI